MRKDVTPLILSLSKDAPYEMVSIGNPNMAQ